METVTFLDFLRPWFKPALVFIIFMLVRSFYKTVVMLIMKKISTTTSSEYADDLLHAFDKPIQFFLLIFAIYAAVNSSELTIIADNPSIDKILRSLFIFCFIWGLYNLSDTTNGLTMRLLHKAGLQFDTALSNIVSTTLRIIMIVLGFVMVAKEWNYDITAFIASLSIGSLAVALAAKDSLANVFGSLVIIIDKPFVIGDIIAANGIEGTVEKITFRSTCLRTYPQELVYIPNSLLSNTPITNFSKREKRRIDFLLGLTYDTTHQQMEHFVKRVKEYLIDHDGLHAQDVTVNFQDFGASSLDIKIVCYTKASTYAGFMATRQQINLGIMDILEEEHLSCAFPSTSLYFETPIPENTSDKMNVK